jgi:glycerophosphoryl diester phosphodiesterase
MSTVVPSILGAYVATSALLMVYPSLLHRRKRAAEQRIVHASHRGGSAEAPENTLHAFANGMAQGTDMLELDVHLTRDKQVVVHHDATLQHTCGRALRIADVDYADLPPIRHRGLPLPSFYHDVGAMLHWAPPDASPVRIPLLAEVFAAFPDAFINIDLKAQEPDDPTRGELRRRVHALIVRHQRQERTAWVAWAVKSLSSGIHLDVLNNIYDRMYI